MNICIDTYRKIQFIHVLTDNSACCHIDNLSLKIILQIGLRLALEHSLVVVKQFKLLVKIYDNPKPVHLQTKHKNSYFIFAFLLIFITGDCLCPCIVAKLLWIKVCANVNVIVPSTRCVKTIVRQNKHLCSLIQVRDMRQPWFLPLHIKIHINFLNFMMIKCDSLMLIRKKKEWHCGVGLQQGQN